MLKVLKNAAIMKYLRTMTQFDVENNKKQTKKKVLMSSPIVDSILVENRKEKKNLNRPNQ